MADIYALTQEALAGMDDIELVDVERAPLGLLRVTIDRPGGVQIEHCEQVSRQLSRVFEVENIDYKRLEVGSPGTDRPLKKVADFLRFADERIEVRLLQAVNGRKVFSGWLRVPEEAGQSGSEHVFGLELEPAAPGKARGRAAAAPDAGTVEILNFTFSDIERAKLDPLLDFKGKKR